MKKSEPPLVGGKKRSKLGSFRGLKMNLVYMTTTVVLLDVVLSSRIRIRPGVPWLKRPVESLSTYTLTTFPSALTATVVFGAVGAKSRWQTPPRVNECRIKVQSDALTSMHRPPIPVHPKCCCLITLVTMTWIACEMNRIYIPRAQGCRS